MTDVIGQSVVRRRRRWTGRGLAWLVGLVAAALLPFAPMTLTTPVAHADPAVFDGKEIKDLCTISSGSQSCPVFPPPPGLINSGALAAAGPEVAASMLALETRAVDNTLADHQLPASDRDAVMSWARDDAQAELWALIVEAIDTAEADRTVVQQHAVDWMSQLTSAQANESAKHAGAEYATWAGLDVRDYWWMADRATQAELTAFLSADVRAFSPLFTERGGYCRYTAPEPYTTEYDGSETPTCFMPCPTPLGCAVPTPTYDQFVTWGQSAATYKTLTNPAFVLQASVISAAILVGTAILAAGIGFTVSATMTSVLLTSALVAAVLPYASAAAAGSTAAFTAAEVIAAEALGAAVGSSVVAAALAVIAIVIVAIVIAVLEGIRVTDNAKLPGKLAEYVVNARTNITDPATLIDTTEGATTLYGLFVGATLPRPRHDLGCDNSLIPPWAYTSSQDPNLLIYVPLGQNTAITTLTDRSGCLNPPPIPPASETDPHFVVSTRVPDTGQPAEVVSPTIAIANTKLDATQAVRLRGNWFIERIARPGRAPVAVQSLRLAYTDWDGIARSAWLLRDDADNYRFVGVTLDASTTTIDPDTCQDDGSCWDAEEIQYVGPDGKDYSASVEAFRPSTGVPSVSTSTPVPVEGGRVEFSANGFAPGNATGVVSYSWRFQNLGCGWLPCLSAVERLPDGKPAPSYSQSVEGATPTHTWQSMGPATVELTARDQSGHRAVTTFVVNVGNVAPRVNLTGDCAQSPPLVCDVRSASVGTPLTVTGQFGDAGDSDDENVVITWGDGHQDSVKAGPNSFNLLLGYLPTVKKIGPTTFSLSAVHTYAEPGIYYGTVSVSDWGGGTDFATFTETITGPQAISFPAVADHQYGDEVPMTATGTLSGKPVTYAASPSDVCQATGENGATVKLVGVGECTITASQAANPPVFGPAPDVQRTFEVTPAALTITAADHTKFYGEQDPDFTPSFDGLVNGDTRADIAGLTIDRPEDKPAGSYPIDLSLEPGSANPGYAITLVDGTLTVRRAPVFITADDKTRTYGAPNPTFTASFDGLVNGDTEEDITGLHFATSTPSAPVGTHTIVPAGATNPNYEMIYYTGTLTVTQAPMTITVDDKSKVYGADDPEYTASYNGLVNGDTKTDIGELELSGPPAGSGAGDYPITGSGAANPNYDIAFVDGNLKITKAALRITADDKSKVYGADDPDFTASYDGLVNGDTRDDVHGLTLTGAPSDSHVGSYPIEVSGATSPNYEVELVDGTETITPAPLRIKADDKSKVYGAEDPRFTASYDGLVNGDTEDDVDDLTISGAPRDAGVGHHLIEPSGARNPDYAITYASGTETITPAPLSIRAKDVTAVSGRVPLSYPWSGKGWVNGDSDATLAKLPNRSPSCIAQIAGPTGPSNLAPGVYPAAITCSGAGDHNYEIGYGSATLTVDPTISLQQRGLPDTVAHKAYLDRSPVALPILARQVGYGTRHTFRFPTVVLGGDGTTYVTRRLRHDGQIIQDIDVTASYLTMTRLVRRAAGEQTIGKREAKRILSRWHDVEALIAAHRNAKAQKALHRFADEVRDQTGARIRAATAQALLTYARAVYRRIGGSGAI